MRTVENMENKIIQMLVRERDAIKEAIKVGRYLDSRDRLKEKLTPHEAGIALDVMNRVIELAKEIHGE